MLVGSAVEYILDAVGAVVGDDAAHLPACAIQHVPGGGILHLGGQILRPPRAAVDLEQRPLLIEPLEFPSTGQMVMKKSAIAWA